MCIWNKVLLGLIGVVSVVLFYMAARTLETQKYWRDSARAFEEKIEQTQDDNLLLAEGVDREGVQKQPGIRQVRLELHKLLLDRRRVWFGCEPKMPIKVGRNDGTAEITLTIDKPASHGIAKRTVLYAFQEADVQKKGPIWASSW